MTMLRVVLALLLAAPAAAQVRVVRPSASLSGAPSLAAPTAPGGGISFGAPSHNRGESPAGPYRPSDFGRYATPAPDTAAGAAKFANDARRLHEAVVRAETSREFSIRAAARLRAEAAPTDEEMRKRMEQLPTTNPEREQFMIDLFLRGGAPTLDIKRQDAGRGRHNIYVLKKGETDRLIVIGGHHDKTHVGEGKIDNGTGATMVANLYQAFRDLKTRASLLFIGFAREEEGLLGSRHYVDGLSDAELKSIEAMINLDTLAVDGVYRWMTRSDRSMLARAEEAAKDSRVPLKDSDLMGGDSDSTSFRQRGVPAMTILGASKQAIWRVIHSPNDTMAAFSMQHYKNAFLLTHALIRSLDEKPLRQISVTR